MAKADVMRTDSRPRRPGRTRVGSILSLRATNIYGAVLLAQDSVAFLKTLEVPGSGQPVLEQAKRVLLYGDLVRALLFELQDREKLDLIEDLDEWGMASPADGLKEQLAGGLRAALCWFEAAEADWDALPAWRLRSLYEWRKQLAKAETVSS